MCGGGSVDLKKFQVMDFSFFTSHLFLCDCDVIRQRLIDDDGRTDGRLIRWVDTVHHTVGARENNDTH